MRFPTAFGACQQLIHAIVVLFWSWRENHLGSFSRLPGFLPFFFGRIIVLGHCTVQSAAGIWKWMASEFPISLAELQSKSQRQQPTMIVLECSQTDWLQCLLCTSAVALHCIQNVKCLTMAAILSFACSAWQQQPNLDLPTTLSALAVARLGLLAQCQSHSTDAKSNGWRKNLRSLHFACCGAAQDHQLAWPFETDDSEHGVECRPPSLPRVGTCLVEVATFVKVPAKSAFCGVSHCSRPTTMKKQTLEELVESMRERFEIGAGTS